MAVSPGTAASEREGEQDARGLLLPDLLIQGFRGIEELAIPRLGRVTLLAGRNGAGKTTVLEAVRVYAARGDYAALSEVLNAREEVFSAVDEDGDLVTELDWEALFFGRAITEGQGIVIGPRENAAEQIRWWMRTAIRRAAGKQSLAGFAKSAWNRPTIPTRPALSSKARPASASG